MAFSFRYLYSATDLLKSKLKEAPVDTHEEFQAYK